MSKNLPIFNKQVRYASFTTRMLASLFDNMIIFLFIIPLATLTNAIFYDQDPSLFFQKFLKEIADKKISLENLFTYISSNDKLYNFLITQNYLQKILYSQIFQFIIIMILYSLLWHFFSTSPGKKILSLKVVDAKTLKSPTIKQSFLRFLAYFISIMPFFLGIFAILFNRRKQAWHDMIADTVVISD